MYNPTAHLELKKYKLELVKEHGKLPDDFDARLTALFAPIFERFQQLYAGHPNQQPALSLLIKTLFEGYLARSTELKNEDAQREHNPGWFCEQHLAGMMLYVDCFNKDLKGLTEKLDYFDELGINFLHLMPLMSSPKKRNDGGYAVSNYKKVDPKYGSNADLLKTAEALHNRSKFLMLDFVVNHTSDEHNWAEKARKGEKHYQDYFYTFPDRSIPDLYEHSMPEVFPESAPGNFTWNKAMKRWVMTVFNTYQWDLNYSNPYVFVEMLNNVLFQANLGVDVFRMDAVAFVWKRMGTTCQNLEEAHWVHQLFKLCTKVVAPGVALLAEAIVTPQEIVKYFGESKVWSNEHDMAYNATFMALLWNSIATRSARVMKSSLRDKPKKPSGTTWVNYARCHDDIGMGFEDRHIAESGFDPAAHRSFLTKFYTGEFNQTFAKGMPFMYNPKTGDARISGSMASLVGLEKALEEKSKLGMKRALNRINLLHGMILSFGGIPMIYAGDEIATCNDYSFLKDEGKADDNRWVHRPMMDWKKAALRKRKNTPEEKIFHALQQMIRVKAASPEFADLNNTKLMETGNQHVFGFLRSREALQTLVLANFNDADESFYAHLIFPHTCLNPFRLIDKLTGEEISVQEGQLQLKPYEMLWLSNPKQS